METSLTTHLTLNSRVWTRGLALMFAALLASTPALGGHISFKRVDQEKPGVGSMSPHHSVDHHSSHPLSDNFGSKLKQSSSQHSHLRLPHARFTAWNAHHHKTRNSEREPTQTTDDHIFGSGNPGQNICRSSSVSLPGLSTTGLSLGVTLGGLPFGVLAPAGAPVIQAVPEPASIVMLGMGALAVLGLQASRSRRLSRLAAPF